MATYRIGIGSFNLKDGAVGIGTEATGLGNLKVEGTYKVTDLDVTGVSTFTRYAGFTPDNLEVGKDSRDRTLTGEHFTTGDIVVGVNSTFTVSVGATVDVGTVPSVSIGTHFSPPTGGVEDRPEVPVEGTVRFNKDLNTLEFYNGVDWRQFTTSSASGRGIIAGGFLQITTPSAREVIDYINIPSKGNSQAFGDLTESRARCSAVASSTRACIQMGQYTNKIDYITIQSTGNAIDFGDTDSIGAGYRSAAGSSTRGLWAGGYAPGGNNNINNIDYIKISTLGNGIDFGDLRGPRWAAGNSGCSNSIRAVFSGGYEGPNAGPAIDGHPSRTIDFVNIASTGNAIDFGKLIANLSGRTGLSNSVRGIWAGGSNQAGKSDSIGYITIASSGNAEYFGDLAVAREMPTASSTQIRGTLGGGRTPSFTQVIDYITIATTGNAVEFGKLRDSWFNGAGCSDSHGGLGGY